jgi:hypothetical protein
MGSIGSAPPAASVPAVEKRQYRNNTMGWLGVVLLDPMGREIGFSMEPQGTIWLSDAEAILTARAPRLPKDNPFEEQVFYEVGENGEQRERRVRPLVPITESRWVPQEDRYIPAAITGTQGASIAGANASGDEPAHATAASDPVADASAAVLANADPASVIPPAEESPPPAAAGQDPTPVAQPAITVPDNSQPPGGAQQSAAPVAQQPPTAPASGDLGAEEQPESWTDRDPNAPAVIKGELDGVNLTPEEQAAADAAAAEAPAAVGSSGDAPAADTATTEEVAVEATSDGEETGAALPPAGEPPEGEFAAHEEVGDPDAAAQTDTPAE